MKKLYEKHRVLFAVAWILVYVLLMTPIKGNLGFDSPWSALALLAIAAGLLIFVKVLHLGEACGLTAWPKDTKRYFYFLPFWILATGNLWSGFSLAYRGMGMVFAVLSMALVGFVEELIFRGLLFRGMLAEGKTSTAILISAMTFGIGHIVNLLSGQASLQTLLQIVFAVSWGFLFTLVFYRGKSLLPCILAHAMIDVFSLFAAENLWMDMLYIAATILTAIVYCLYLWRRKEAE